MCAHATKHTYWVYLLASRRNGTLYIGVTNDLKHRVWQHKTKTIEGFTKQYGVDQLVYFEQFRDVNQAIGREKEIKGWLRKRKLVLIETENAQWADLSADWFESSLDSSLRSVPSQRRHRT